jgi:putative sterol carrier protein
MARFLSEEWFRMVREALPQDEEPPGDGAVSVRHRVTGGPDGDVDYVVRAGAGRFSIEPAEAGPVDIEVVESYESAAAIHQGRLTPAAAFAAGRLKLGGDVALLAARQDELAALGRLLAPVRAVTTY